jgi:hypothetical protein
MKQQWITNLIMELSENTNGIKDHGHSLLANTVDENELNQIKENILDNLERLNQIIEESYDL